MLRYSTLCLHTEARTTILVIVEAPAVDLSFQMSYSLKPFKGAIYGMDRIWGIRGSYYHIPKAIFYLPKED